MANRKLKVRPVDVQDEEAVALLRARLSDRFDVIGRLGVGGMGAVYEVQDRKRDERVALKTLHELSPESLYRFKHEFRGLADLSHANLAALFELFASDEGWFFTMELVRGVSLLEWVRPPLPGRTEAASQVRLTAPRRAFRGPEEVTALVTPSEVLEAPVVVQAPAPAPPVFDEQRIRHAFGGLASGLAALHAGDRVHRDVKPSNVLVTPDGRVVVLDFGIMGQLGARAGVDERIVGTPSYMAPEQSRPGARPSPANDWYSFGVVLYEALCGRRPFLGRSGAEIIDAKRRVNAAHVKDVAPHAPRDLAHLCDDLLARDPIERPGEAEILARLAGRTATTVVRRDFRPSMNVEVIGRREALTALRASFGRARGGRSEVVLLHGRAGMGKTKLLEQFLDELARRTDVLVLRGRCYERESVPYKALDDLVDALGRHLATRSVADLMALLPPELSALTEAFPVLLRVRSIAVLVADEGDRPREVTRGALRALKHVLQALAAEKTVVLAVDDLHWGDADSAPLFTELASEDGVPLLFLATFRSDHRDRSALLQTISRGARGEGTARVEDVALAPLQSAELERLVRELLGPAVPRTLVEHIASEASGNPQFAVELARHARTTGDLTSRTTLDAVLRARSGTLGLPARRLLELVAAAGGPLPARVLEHAAGLGEGRGKVFAELVAASFVERSGVVGEERYDVAHDAVRHALLGELPDDRTHALHLALAQAIESTAGADLDVHRLAGHLFHAWPTAGDAGKVFAMCHAAGRAAAASYAYDQAYEHLRRASQVADASGIVLDLSFRTLLGDAAARAGHFAPGIASFRAALALATTPVERASLHAAIAKVHLSQLDAARSGAEIAAGLRELGERTASRAVTDIVCTLVILLGNWLAARLGRTPARVDAVERTRLRTLAQLRVFGAITAYFAIDPVGQLHSLLRLVPVARRVGDLPELATAAAAGSVFARLVGLTSTSARLERTATRISRELEDPLLVARVEQYRGHSLNFGGHVAEAERVLSDCLATRGPYLDNVDYLTGTADLAGILLLRGRAKEALRHVENALERMSVDGAGAALAVEHTYYCYSATALALVGRVDEGRRRIEAFGARIERPDQTWQKAQWLAHRALFLAEVGETGTLFDESVAAFRALGFAPDRVPLQMRHFYIAQAWGRLAQLDGSKGARARWKKARKELHAAAGTHPTLVAHRLCLEAAYLDREGDREGAEAIRLEADVLASETDNLLVRWELLVQRAQNAARRGDPAIARRHHGEAEAIAEREGWTVRLARLRDAQR